MPIATKTKRKLIHQQCRICQDHEGCWGTCEGKEIKTPYLTIDDLARGLGPPAERELACFRLAETRHGDFDPATGDFFK